MWLVLCALIGGAVVVSSHYDGVAGEPLARTPSGTFRGSMMTSMHGRNIEAYRGIRYAEPPVGILRFKPPRMIEHYGGATVDASRDGPACPQPTHNFYNVSEDCLRINVYVPRDRKQGMSLPVFMYMHPGGFYAVSGQSKLGGPKYLLDHDIVLVTINYRLGSLGFISTGDQHAPGNAGLKDQVAALRWIQRNIRGFGGDPAQVTIGGYSAGSFSTILHMLSPMSKGLFHRAIAMSGSPTGQWEVPHQQLHLARRQAELVGCPTTSSAEIISCLNTKPAEELGDSLPRMFEFNYDPVLLWRPIIEPIIPGVERFLTDDPELLIRRGQIVNDVPLMLGMTELEFTGIAFDVLSNDSLRETMDTEWERIAPISFLLPRKPDPNSATISRRMRDAYLPSGPLVYDNDTAFALGRLYADGLISYGVHKLSRAMSEHLHSPLYYYKFNYTGSVSHAYYPGTTRPIGAVHHDELIYLFQGEVFPEITRDSPHARIVQLLTSMWTNFIIRGDPTPADWKNGPRWPQLHTKSRQFLQINQNDQVVLQNMYEERYKLWEELFPLKPLH